MNSYIRKRSYLLSALLAPLSVGAQSNVYVANLAGNNIAVLSPSFSVIGSVPVAQGPTGLGVTPNGASVYVSCQSANVVSVINTSSNSVIANIPVGAAPTQLAISPDGTRVIVSDSGSNQVSIIETGSNSVIGTVGVGSKPSGLAFSRDGSRAFVANSFSNNVSIIDTSSNSVIGTFNSGAQPSAILVTPNGQRIYVANGGSGSVTVHDLWGNLLATVTGFAYPNSLGITNNGSRVFVSNGNAGSASVIDTSSNTVIANIGTGTLPTAVAISSDGSKAFVTNEYGFSLSVIDTASNVVINTIERVGVYPVGVATAPATFQAPAPIAPSCTYSLSGNGSFGTNGGSGSVTVTTSPSCSWSASSNSAWLSITGGASGSGTGTVYFSASANASISALSGSLTIAGQTFIVSDAGISCSYSLSSYSGSMTVAGGAGTVTAYAPAGCGWSVSSDAAWLTVTSPLSGTGTGVIAFSTNGNLGGARSGALHVGGMTLDVSQAGVAPSTPPTSATEISTIFGSSPVPTQFAYDPSSLELGVKIRSDVNGFINGIRFYKGSTDTGVHNGSLWTTSGQLLATGTFTNETAGGWQTLAFTNPVAITANTTYVASYHTSTGYFYQRSYFQNQGADNPPLHALKDGVNGPNGVYAFGPGGTFPSQTYAAMNYWVDVTFSAGQL